MYFDTAGLTLKSKIFFFSKAGNSEEKLATSCSFFFSLSFWDEPACWGPRLFGTKCFCMSSELISSVSMSTGTGTLMAGQGSLGMGKNKAITHPKHLAPKRFGQAPTCNKRGHERPYEATQPFLHIVLPPGIHWSLHDQCSTCKQRKRKSTPFYFFFRLRFNSCDDLTFAIVTVFTLQQPSGFQCCKILPTCKNLNVCSGTSCTSL